MKLRTALPALAVTLGLVVTGCSSASTDPTPSGSATTPAAQPGVVFNDADVTFLADMHPHHAQALTMATMVEGHSTRQSVIDLATTIKGEQQPEMDTMASLLTSFGKPSPSADPSMGGMDMGSMTGMMSAQEMTKLGTLSGTEFDRTWLTMMTEHHAGAVQMAKVELASGANNDAKALATTIIAAQNSEIETMKGLLAGL